MRCYRGISQVKHYWNAIACHLVLQFKHLLRYCIVLYCISSTGDYIAQHMILPWHIIGYHSLGCYCTSYGIVIWTFIYTFYICLCFHCLKASRSVLCGRSCDVIANHWWSFNRISLPATWYCNFKICWGAILYHTLITWDHIAYCILRDIILT